MLNKYDFKYILKRVLVFIAIGFIMSLMSSCEVKAETIRLQPSVNYYYPTQLNSVFNNRVISDNRFWGVKISNTGILDSLSWTYPYTPPVQDNSLYNYTFIMYSTYGGLNITLNGRACYTIDSIDNGANNVTNSKMLVFCTNIPYSENLTITMNNEIINTYGSDWYIGLSWALDVQKVNASDVASAVNEVNNTINDSSVDTSNNGSGGAFGNMEQSQAQNGTISSLVLMPITLLQSILNGFNGSCSGVNLGTIFDYEFILPCINPQDYIGIIWNIIDTICAGFIAYSIGKRMVVIFNNLTNLRDGGLAEAYD